MFQFFPFALRHHRIYYVKQANYFSGNMTDTLTFRYTVVETDNTDVFDVLNTQTNKRQRFSTALVRPPAAEVSLDSANLTPASLAYHRGANSFHALYDFSELALRLLEGRK